MANIEEYNIDLLEDSWKRDAEKLENIIAEAKAFISSFDDSLNHRNSIEEPEQLQEETVKLEKIVRKRMKVENSVSKDVQENKASLGSKRESNLEKRCFREFHGECSNVCEVTEKQKKHIHMDLDECAMGDEGEEDHNAIILYSDESLKDNGLINLEIVQSDQLEGLKVKEALNLFELRYKELLQAALRGESKATYAYLEAAKLLKAEGKWVSVEKHFGHIPGIEIGYEFRFRVELAVVGLHRQLVSGIDYVIFDGKKVATSVVDSGRYENEARALDVLIYSGQGGNPKLSDNVADQKLEKGNLALVNSMEMGYPVRVTYKKIKAFGTSTERNYVYVYDGIYTIHRFWQERDQNGKLGLKFELHRIPGQPKLCRTIEKSKKSKRYEEICILDDVSKGKENHPVRAVNGVDNDRPPSFNYVTKMVYPPWHQTIEPDGCSCIDGCLDSEKCLCVLKNGGEIPFNEKGAIIRAKPMVHECGPSCKCPPSCMNRVTQHGPRLQLEIFKTKTRGWGVRSRNYISSGSFICEYVGQLLEDAEADKVSNDEYLFDIWDSYNEKSQREFEGVGSKSRVEGFAIDALRQGNVGRFINHSCSPNLYGQEILFDHYDKRMPHIMFFAAKNIPPLQELTYDYNYKLDRICDVNGNVKTKACYCGSRNCRGRLY